METSPQNQATRQLLVNGGNVQGSFDTIEFGEGVSAEDMGKGKLLLSVPGGGDSNKIRGKNIEVVTPTDGKSLVFDDDDDEWKLVPAVDLPLDPANIQPGTNGQLMITAGGVATWFRLIPAGGVAGQVLMSDGAGGLVWGDAGGGLPDVDPATLSLFIYNKPDYAGEPWAGAASVGTSATRSLIAGVEPPPGTIINGHVPVALGTPNYLVDATTTMTALLSADWTYVVLVKPDSFGADGSGYDEPAFIADTTGYFACVVSASGARVYWFDSGVKVSAPRVAVSIGEYVMLAFRKVGGKISVSKNGGAFTAGVPVGAINAGAAASTLIFGRNYSGNYIEGDVPEHFFAQSDISASLGGIKSFFETKYGITLTP
jgi:hypothetical protein